MCLLDVYADEGNDIAKLFRYKVPVLGIENNPEIFIILSLKQRYDASKGNN